MSSIPDYRTATLQQIDRYRNFANAELAEEISSVHLNLTHVDDALSSALVIAKELPTATVNTVVNQFSFLDGALHELDELADRISRDATVDGSDRQRAMQLQRDLLKGTQTALTQIIASLGTLTDKRRQATISDGLTALRSIVATTLTELQAAELDKNVQKSREASELASEYAADSAVAAGITGTTHVASYFEDYASREGRAAELLRIGAISTILLVAVLALPIFLKSSTNDDSSWARELARLSISIPFAALSAYLARESSRHRATAKWAKLSSIQLLAVRAYTDELPDEFKYPIRSELGRKVFGNEPDSETLTASPDPSILWQLLQRGPYGGASRQ